tara:strand:+ start:3373 stop:4653 length:1281 start_codon:yes stop_codon:yes gene_type:complete
MGTIRSEQTRLLQTNATENIEFFVYDSDGNAKSPLFESKNVLIQTPSVMQPINSNLQIEYIRPLRDAIKTTKISQDQIINKNPNFRYSTFNWDITASKATVKIPDQIEKSIKPISGLFCLRQPIVTNTFEKTTHMIKNILNDTPVESGRDIMISYYYRVFTLGFSAVNATQFLSVGLDSTNNGTINKMFDFEANKFDTGTFTDDRFFKKIDINTFDTWKKYSTSVSCNLTTTETAPHIEVKLFEMTAAGLNPVAFYDGFAINQKPLESTREHRKRNGGSFDLIDGSLVSVQPSVTGEYLQEETILSNEIDSNSVNNIFGTFARKDRPNAVSTINTLDKCVLQEIINDYRNPVKRYEGEFYKNDADEVPIYFYHKIWINYGAAILQEPVSCIIDELEYNVKQNQYKITMHLPNQDDDQTSFDIYNIN